ncbi:hypothetical protein [Metabacillus endolithicus]|uniref:Uncharacterized protein n=2 Tax=Metabacillus endolithicus TaxID=1535204 RepID=A0ABW5C603_9BACI|nr:hypothetical protein [Metabacillus endolithicus]UPG66031.1 hypothetical protein MVE64_26660 [Metabacillus endolithicus]
MFSVLKDHEITHLYSILGKSTKVTKEKHLRTVVLGLTEELNRTHQMANELLY